MLGFIFLISSVFSSLPTTQTDINQSPKNNENLKCKKQKDIANESEFYDVDVILDPEIDWSLKNIKIEKLKILYLHALQRYKNSGSLESENSSERQYEIENLISIHNQLLKLYNEENLKILNNDIDIIEKMLENTDSLILKKERKYLNIIEITNSHHLVFFLNSKKRLQEIKETIKQLKSDLKDIIEYETNKEKKDFEELIEFNSFRYQDKTLDYIKITEMHKILAKIGEKWTHLKPKNEVLSQTKSYRVDSNFDDFKEHIEKIIRNYENIIKKPQIAEYYILVKKVLNNNTSEFSNDWLTNEKISKTGLKNEDQEDGISVITDSNELNETDSNSEEQDDEISVINDRTNRKK